MVSAHVPGTRTKAPKTVAPPQDSSGYLIAGNDRDHGFHTFGKRGVVTRELYGRDRPLFSLAPVEAAGAREKNG